MVEPSYAHTKDNEPPDRWQTLEDHLRRVAEPTRSFADEFEVRDWGYGMKLKRINRYEAM